MKEITKHFCSCGNHLQNNSCSQSKDENGQYCQRSANGRDVLQEIQVTLAKEPAKMLSYCYAEWWDQRPTLAYGKLRVIRLEEYTEKGLGFWNNMLEDPKLTT